MVLVNDGYLYSSGYGSLLLAILPCKQNIDSLSKWMIDYVMRCSEQLAKAISCFVDLTCYCGTILLQSGVAKTAASCLNPLDVLEPPLNLKKTVMKDP